MDSFLAISLVFCFAISACAQSKGGGGRGGRGPGGPPPQGGWGGNGRPPPQRDPHGGWGGPPPPGGPHGRWGGHGGPHGGPGGHRGPHGPPNIYDMFPACASLAESMRTKHCEMMQSGQIGPRNCKEQNHKKCMQRDMEAVRCEITEETPEECMDQIIAFIQGDMCNGGGGEETDGEPLDPTTNERAISPRK
ncbi:pulmonary surfactant-associated protein A-like [Argiope bruennichi]|uniref:pulmonary surfactant-associated protein A-like n=1 Tax=Argiope bruennichi TaxID=94029 RepID=UPI0024954811|nr:pulmonary surfactant-associated protein A-like [Argiope bruennichi]